MTVFFLFVCKFSLDGVSALFFLLCNPILLLYLSSKLTRHALTLQKVQPILHLLRANLLLLSRQGLATDLIMKLLMLVNLHLVYRLRLRPSRRQNSLFMLERRELVVFEVFFLHNFV
jgi:hypothetical protein